MILHNICFINLKQLRSKVYLQKKQHILVVDTGTEIKQLCIFSVLVRARIWLKQEVFTNDEPCRRERERI